LLVSLVNEMQFFDQYRYKGSRVPDDRSNT
jgi:hypothetical protein